MRLRKNKTISPKGVKQKQKLKKEVRSGGITKRRSEREREKATR
jgi:hypothetical protein